MSEAARAPEAAANEHGCNLAHHFDDPQQQIEASKLGMWLFLAQEVLFFGGLFAAYAYFRGRNPDMFLYAHKLLSWKMGAFNTVVLICSSLTMAMGVRAAQLGRRKTLIWMLILTLIFAGTFLGVKYVEYKQKFEHHLLWGKSFHPEAQLLEEHGIPRAIALEESGVVPEAHEERATGAAADTPAVAGAAGAGDAVDSAGGGDVPAPAGEPAPPENLHIFFGLYFALTGLHGLHVVLGMVVIGWILRRSVRGDFGPDYFTPVDMVGLYWHLVDLIWIFLFPLLYLIG